MSEKMFGAQGTPEQIKKAEEENLKYQKDDYSHNLVSNLDVLNALEEFLGTRQDANTVEYGMKTNYWKLQMAISHRIPEWAEGKSQTQKLKAND